MKNETLGHAPWAGISAEWVARLPAVVMGLNDEPTCLTDKKAKEAVRMKTMAQKPPSIPANWSVGLHEPLLPYMHLVSCRVGAGV